MKNTIASALALASAIALLLPLPGARATSWSSAVDLCQGALPSFEGNLRKRPLGVNNEGAADAFVSCAIKAPLGLEPERIDEVIVLFTNRGSEPATINCTLVEGIAPPFPSFQPVYLPKSVEVTAGEQNLLRWDTEDNDDSNYAIPNLSCKLPPGAELNVVQANTSTPV